VLSVFADAPQSVSQNPGDCKCGGEIVAGPLRNEQGILYVDTDPRHTGIMKRALDITGHCPVRFD
jgi:hypothetical protein